MSVNPQPLVILAGPTASGKTDIAIELCERFPLDIISVDSAMVYRGLDIGSAKPDPDTLERAPHRLINIRDPEERYSAGDFCRDAIAEMNKIWADRRVPLLTGGTMLYFRALLGGLAELPSADAEVRAAIDAESAAIGWPAMHKKLLDVDPGLAGRVSENDSQRIQRALEVYRVTGRPLSDLQREGAVSRPIQHWEIRQFALFPEDRKALHERIAKRFQTMLAAGFADEVRTLMRRPGLGADLPSMRSVGYRQMWQALAGQCSLQEAADRAVAATRQLAKRQLTWIRGDSEYQRIDPLECDAIGLISSQLGASGF